MTSERVPLSEPQPTATSSTSGQSTRKLRKASSFDSNNDASPVGHVVGNLYDKWGTSSLKDYIVDEQDDERSMHGTQSESAHKRSTFGTFANGQAKVTRPPPALMQSDDEGFRESVSLIEREPIDLRSRSSIFTVINAFFRDLFSYIAARTCNVYSKCTDACQRRSRPTTTTGNVGDGYESIDARSTSNNANASLVDMLPNV